MVFHQKVIGFITKPVEKLIVEPIKKIIAPDVPKVGLKDLPTSQKIQAGLVGLGAVATTLPLFAPTKAISVAGKVTKTVAGFIVKEPIKAVGIGLGAPLVAGVLLEAPQLLDPSKRFEVGREIGKIIEDPSILKEKISPTTAGLIGAGVGTGLGVAGATLIPQIIERFTTEKIEKEKISPFVGEIPFLSPQLPTTVTPTTPSVPMENGKILKPEGIKITVKPSVMVTSRPRINVVNQIIR